MIVTLCGPSCAGKSTLESMLKARGFENLISITTRQMRDGEVNGVSYYFVSKEEFLALDVSGGLVEHVCFGGNYYGVSVKEIERLVLSKKPVVIVCEPIGQKNLVAFCKSRGWPIYGVFVSNPADVIADRFLARLADELNGAEPDVAQVKRGAYAKRLGEMLSTERGWVEEALSGDFYDMVVSEFNSNNDAVVADLILSKSKNHNTD